MALSERREGLLTSGIVTASTQSKRATQRSWQTSASRQLGHPAQPVMARRMPCRAG